MSHWPLRLLGLVQRPMRASTAARSAAGGADSAAAPVATGAAQRIQALTREKAALQDALRENRTQLDNGRNLAARLKDGRSRSIVHLDLLYVGCASSSTTGNSNWARVSSRNF
jgi:hypothetical protein